MEKNMSLDTILVVIAVTAMFATFAFVLGWGDRQTRNLSADVVKPKQSGR
jgi:hypothetical protein